jgi:hypothetical protein
MNQPQSRRSLRLPTALLALSLAAMTTQVGGATASPGLGEPPAAQASVAAALPIPGERELLAWLTRALPSPPESGNWALLIAGLTGAWAIGRRRMSSSGSRALDLRRLRQ